jgi:hypothetical protein
MRLLAHLPVIFPMVLLPVFCDVYSKDPKTSVYPEERERELKSTESNQNVPQNLAYKHAA